ncbi:MAG: hypothetical protein SNF33_02465 [Candidatus Algichlamydia australiensis]|nr:hypothetical protein [Chlamydiales bacterium]
MFFLDMLKTGVDTTKFTEDDEVCQKILKTVALVNFVSGGFFVSSAYFYNGNKAILGALLLINSKFLYSYAKLQKRFYEDERLREAIGESEEKRKEAIEDLGRVSSSMNNTTDTMNKLYKEVVEKTEQLQEIAKASDGIGDASQSLSDLNKKFDELIAGNKKFIAQQAEIIDRINAEIPLKSKEDVDSDPIWKRIDELNKKIDAESDPVLRIELEFEQLALEEKINDRRKKQIKEKPTNQNN